MAFAGDTSTGAFLNTGFGTARIWGGIEYNVTRTNNTVNFTSTRARIRYVRESGSWTSFTYGAGWTWRMHISGVRTANSASGTRAPDNTDWGSSVNFSVGVGANDTSITGQVSAYFAGDGETYTGGLGLSIPALGAPTGVTATFSLLSSRTVRLSASVSGWGANATAGSGQRIEWKKVSDGAYTNEAYSTATSHNRDKTGLTPNTQYNLRSYALNGGGKSTNSAGTTFVTLSDATETSKTVLATTVSFLLAPVQGFRSTSTFVRYRKTGDVAWINSATQTGATPTVGISGLLPNTDYEYQLAVTTTEGTWYGDTQTLTTLPAGKLVMPNGDVLNAIPRLVYPNGDVEMVNINLVE